MNMNIPIQNQAMMGMPGMQNMQNQFTNYNDMQIKILIDPYLEKIKKLEEEIREKDLQITQLKFKLMQNNNMNQMNNELCQMSDQMNINNIVKENILSIIDKFLRNYSYFVFYNRIIVNF